jgi:diaminobutyrate acetyltransferase
MPGPTTSNPAPADPDHPADPAVELRAPRLEDGAAMWRIAADSKVLDVNSSYAYLLWCRDFAMTSVVATVDEKVGGFVTGYLRPERPDTVMVWQVAVDEQHRGRRLARRMLDALADRLHEHDVCRMETTITSDNEASIRLFTSFAEGRDTVIEREPGIPAEAFPDGHDAEDLYRIGPW